METTDYCNYELSCALKKAGFDEPCIAQWACEPDGKPMLFGSTAFVFSNADLKGHDVVAPFLWQAQKWLREVKGIAINVIAHAGGRYDFDFVALPAFVGTCYDWTCLCENPLVNSYEGALGNGIEECLKLLDNENEK